MSKRLLAAAAALFVVAFCAALAPAPFLWLAAYPVGAIAALFAGACLASGTDRALPPGRLNLATILIYGGTLATAFACFAASEAAFGPWRNQEIGLQPMTAAIVVGAPILLAVGRWLGGFRWTAALLSAIAGYAAIAASVVGLFLLIDAGIPYSA